VQPIAKVSSWIPVCDPKCEKGRFQQRSPEQPSHGSYDTVYISEL
jgi:hypothetical protein